MFSSSQNNRFSFGHDEHFVFDAVLLRGEAQTLERLFDRLVAEPKSSVVHRDKRSCIQFLERDDRLLGVHVHLAIERGFVRPNRQERDLDVVTFANFLESLEVSGVPAMKNRAAVCADDESAKTAMGVSEKARAPMMRRRQRDAQWTELNGLPFAELMDDVESEPMNQTSDAN